MNSVVSTALIMYTLYVPLSSISFVHLIRNFGTMLSSAFASSVRSQPNVLSKYEKGTHNQ